MGPRLLPSAREQKGENGPSALLAPAPLEDLLVRLSKETADVSRRSPQSDLAQALASFRDDLATAIDAASKLKVWASVEDVHERTGVPKSSIRRWCTNNSQRGATKFNGSWKINLPVFTAQMLGESSSKEAVA